MAASTSDELFAEGIALFNRGRYFECHEVLEEMWKRMRGSERAVVQGIIQAAAALLHLERGNLSGARSLYLKARTRLEAAPAEYRGFRIGRLRGDLTACFESVGESQQRARRREEPGASTRLPVFPRLHRLDA